MVSSGLSRSSLSRRRCSKVSGVSTWVPDMQDERCDANNRGECTYLSPSKQKSAAKTRGPKVDAGSLLCWMLSYSYKWRTPIARCAAFVTTRKTLQVIVRFISHSHTRPSKLRNLAICAHIGGLYRALLPVTSNYPISADSGKTTLTESILLKSSFISTPGSVDTGSTTTDFLPAERERGI